MNDSHNSVDDAIRAALTRNWKEAIRINVLLIKASSNDAEGHTRLGFAYMQSGQFTSAKKAFQKALKLDPYNQIAERNLKRLGTLKQKDVTNNTTPTSSPLTFIEEPGKTKIVVCINVAPTNVLSRLSSGQEVFMKPKKHCVEIRDTLDCYLGALPDDVSFRLIKLLEGGNSYALFVKSVAKKQLMVFIREISRGNKFANQPSFIASHQYTSSGSPEGKIGEPLDASASGEEKEGSSENEDSTV